MREQLNSLRQLQEIDLEILLVESNLASQSTEDGSENGKLSKLRKNRTKLAEKIEQSFLAQYEKLRSGITGSVFALAENGLCKSCNLRLPSNLYQQTQIGSALCICPNCRRILSMASEGAEEAQGAQTIVIGED